MPIFTDFDEEVKALPTDGLTVKQIETVKGLFLRVKREVRAFGSGETDASRCATEAWNAYIRRIRKGAGQ